MMVIMAANAQNCSNTMRQMFVCAKTHLCPTITVDVFARERRFLLMVNANAHTPRFKTLMETASAPVHSLMIIWEVASAYTPKSTIPKEIASVLLLYYPIIKGDANVPQVNNSNLTNPVNALLLLC